MSNPLPPIVATLVLAAALVSCRAGSGERCLCAADCRSGLVCAVSGGNVLDGDECVGIEDGGTCVPEGDIPDPSGGPMSTGPYMDLGSKRDFEPDPSTSGGTQGSGSDTSTGGGSDTSTSTGGSTSSTGP